MFGSMLAGVLSLGLLTGCAGQSDYPLALASKLQTSVQLVTQLASDGEYQAALTALQNLRDDLAAAQKDGTVDADRMAEIEAAIAAVSKDLKTKIGNEMVPDAKNTPSHDVETSQAPAPVPQVPVNPVPAPEAPAPAPVPEPVPSSGSGIPTTPEPSSTPAPEDTSSPLPTPPVEETSPEPVQPPPSSTIPEPKPSLTPGMPGRGVQPPPQQPPHGESNNRSEAATP